MKRILSLCSKVSTPFLWLLIAYSLVMALFFVTLALSAEQPSEVEVLRQRVKQLEIEALKLRLNLADEKLVVTKFEFNTLITERARICNELSAADQKTFSERCTEKK